MPSDKASICSPAQITPAPWCRLPGPYLLIVLQHLRPNKDGIIFIVIKTEKAVTLNPLLPCVYDSYLLFYGRPATPWLILFYDVINSSIPIAGQPVLWRNAFGLWKD